MKKTKPKRTKLDGYIFGALAKIWRWWPPRAAVIKAHTRKIDGKEESHCQKCDGWFPVAETRTKKGKIRRKRFTEVDHIHPKVDPKKGFYSWDDLIERTFVPQEKLQNLCKDCHRKKTNGENSKRRKKK